jgi:hypothetical protein
MSAELKQEAEFTDAEHKLYDLMSEISEDCWCAQWMCGNEFALWDAIADGDLKYGQSEIDRALLSQVAALSVKTGKWIIWRDDHDGLDPHDVSEWGPYAISLADWKQRLAATHPSPIPAQTPDEAQEVRYLLNNALPVLTREYPSLAGEVRKFLDGHPVEAIACPTCPKDTPYGPAFCGKCMEAREAAYEGEASAGDGLTDEQIENVLETARECIVEGHGYKYNESDLRAAIRSLVASHIKAGGQVGSGEDPSMANIRSAIEDYYHALNNRQHGGVAMDRAFRAIERETGMSWGMWERAERATLSKATDGGGA